MSDNTQLNPGVNGDRIVTEEILPSGSGIKIQAIKIHTGAHGVDGDAVTAANPLFIGPTLFNGTGPDQQRSADGAAGATPSLGRAYSANGTPAMTSLSAVTANGNGTAFNMKTAARDYTLAVSTTGSPTGWSVQLQGSLDGTNWASIGAAVTQATGSAAFGALSVTGAPWTQVRAVLSGLTGGTSPTVTAIVAAV